MNWREAEALVARIVKGALVTEKARQLLDIDVEDMEGRTYSVKFQKAAAKWGNLSFETELEDAAGETVPGNFAKCEAEFCVFVVPWQDRTEVLCFRHVALADVLHRGDYPRKGLSAFAEASNAGRRFIKATNIIAPLADLRPHAVWIQEEL